MRPAEDDKEFDGTHRFKVVRRLGAGGMGIVYEAVDRDRESRIALKTLRTMSPEELLCLKNEFRALQDVTHPNLVSLGELIEDRDRWFFTMELVEGENLLRYVRGHDGVQVAAATTVTTSESTATTTAHAMRPVRGGTAPVVTTGASDAAPRIFDEHRLRHALGQLALGLIALHGARKVHRDIKPGNVLVNGDGRVVLLDFGLAFDTQRESRWEPRFAGTPGYMAPELFTSGTIGPASDWYATGVLLFEALTGRQPFTAPNRLALIEAQQQDPPSPSELDPTIPADLDALCVALLRREPERRPDGHEVLRRLGLTPRPHDLSRVRHPFVGRGGEMSRLSDALGEVLAGRGATVLIRGESGVGKSYLVRQFIKQVVARHAEAVVLAGRCYERESVPYKALDGIVDELTRYLGASMAYDLPAFLPPGIGSLAQVFPVLRQILVSSDAPLSPGQASAASGGSGSFALPWPGWIDEREPQVIRAQAVSALRELLRRIAVRQLLVLVIDDLHWTDADSLPLLRELVRQPDAPPLLLVATLRDTDVGQVSIAELAQALPVPEDHHVRLGALSTADAEQLVTRLARDLDGGHAVDVRAIAREASGHPMFIHELMQHVALGQTDTLQLPRLDDAIMARIDRLEPASRTIIEVVALAGRPLDQETIARATGLDFEEFAQRVVQLRVGNLVRTRGARRGDPIEPCHDRVREAVVARFEPARRAALHEHLAVALEVATHADAETLAVHWRGAGFPQHALRHAVRAAEQAGQAMAFRRAARLYRFALELGVASDDERRALTLHLGDALASAGDGVDAATAYLGAAAAGPASERVELERRAGDQLLRAGHIDRGIELIRSVLARSGMALPATPGRALASMLRQRAMVRLRGLRFVERPASEVPPAELARIDICWSLVSLGLVDTIRGAEIGARHLLLALRAGEPSRLARALAVEAVYASQMGGGAARARKLLEAAGRLAEQDATPAVLGIVAGNTGLVEYVLGNYRTAREHLERAEDRFLETAGVAWEIGVSRLFALICLYNEGRLDDLARRIPPILAEAEDHGDLFTATSIRVAAQHVALVAADRIDEARRNVDDAMAGWSQTAFQMQHRYALVTHVELDLCEGRGQAAHHRIEERWRDVESSMLMHIRQQRVDTYSARGRAALAAAVESQGRAREALLSQAARHARRIAREDMPWAVGLGRLIAAGVARGRGDDEDAVAALDGAIAGFDGAGMALHAAVARGCRGRLVGGLVGAAQVAASEAWMAGAGIVNRERMIAMLAPGFGE